MAAILTVQSVDKSFGTRRVLAGVSFAVHERDRVGLVGVNGSGKSTLMKLIVASGGGSVEGGRGAASDDKHDQEPDAGLITRRRDLRLEYVAQEPPLDETRTVMETLREGLRGHADAVSELARIEAEISTLAGGADSRLKFALDAQALLHQRISDLGGWDQDHEIRGLASALSLPPFDAIVGRLSGGERRRVALARALLSRPDLLALDEPTNHLDATTIEWLEERLRALSGALLLVTHDRYFLDRVATRILELDRGKLYSYEGNYSRFVEKQAERLATETSKENARASFVRRELDWIRRGPKARSTKQKARIDRFDDAVAARPQTEDKRSGPMVLRLSSGGRLGKTILELKEVTKTIAGRVLVEKLSLIMTPGDRIGIVGPNGAGKTTLVKTILGMLPADEGEVVVGLNTRFAFLDQTRAELDDQSTVLAEVAGDSENVFLEDGPVHVRTFLRMLLFDDGFADSRVGTLSGGERNRVQLAKLLRAGGNLLVLDEPTNDLDLMTLGVLEDALASFPGCALVVSHDRWFLDRVATGILAFEGDGRVVFYEGNYSDYLERRAIARAEEAARVKAEAAPKVKAPSGKVERSGPKKLSYKEQRELEGMEAAIMAAEERVTALDQRLNDPALYKDRSAEVPGLVATLEATKKEVETLYARWQELEAAAATTPSTR